MRMSNKQKTVLRRSAALIMAIPAVAWDTAYAQTADTESAARPIESPQFAAPWVVGTSPTMTTAGAVQFL